MFKQSARAVLKLYFCVALWRCELSLSTFLLFLFLPLFVSGQTIVATNGVQIYAALTNTTVVVSNRAEVHVSASTAPLTTCVVHLNSSDSSFVFQNVKPSTVVSTYLSQLVVNGAAAVADSNCRVVQYGAGTIVLPHSSTFQPLQVFSQPHFTGASNFLGQYTYYKGSGLGAMNATISSFKLKRGYMATFAENESGNGQSRNYVAADGDVEISALPDSLDNKVRFVYVTAWRWASKKGIAGNIESGLNLGWKYNWNNSENSTRDVQYIPIRQERWWPGLDSDWKARGSDHVLGYNEPDKADQANMTIGDAIYSWPDLLGTGLRLGSPATSDGGRSSWLYPFISQADAAGLRVDFTAVHYYWCYNPADPNGAANQMYNFLKEVYDTTKRPIWITEWNNGANWTGCGDPSYAQQAACINAMIDMLDSTPFVERYAPYNWVEDVRRLKWDDGSLTTAGVAYRDQVSPIGYLQGLPSNGTRSFSQLQFENNALDSSGYANNGVIAGAQFTNGMRGDALVFDGATTKVTLPPNVATGSAFSFAAWIYWDGGSDWQRIFDFGNSTTHYVVLTPRSSSGTMRFKIKNGGTEHQIDAPALTANEWHHVAVTLGSGTARIFLDGNIVASATGWTASPASFSPRVNFLGESQFTADPLFKGKMDEVLITDYAIGAAQMASLLTNNPPQFSTNYIAGGGATELITYSNNVAAYATDPDIGDTLTFSKASGPAWLNVAANGALTGSPTSGDGGTNFFTIRVTDVSGQNAFLLFSVNVTTVTAAGTWTFNGSSFWGTASAWSNSVVATGPGQTANFGAIDITGNHSVILNSSRTIGTLRFGDTASPFMNRFLSANVGYSLTLDSASSASPSIQVTNTVTISAPLQGTNGFTKSGPGTLILSGNNGLSGTVNIDTSSTTASDGITRINGPGAIANASLIQIRNNNGGSSTFQLDGTTGSITINAPVIVTCRNNTVGTIQNLAGTNIFNGNILLEVGGNTHTIQSDSGMIVFTGTNRFVGGLTGGRTYFFTGAGHHYLVGPLLNSTNGAPIALLKTNTGTLIMDAVNTYGNGTTLAGGTMIVNGTLPSGTFNISTGTTLGGRGTIYPSVTIPSGATIAPGSSIGTLTVSNNVTLSAGSTTRIELNKAASTNDQLRVTGNLAYGGTLAVTNLDGQLWAGDTFQIFDSPTKSGVFAATNLPALIPGFFWTWTPAAGTLSIGSTVALNPTNITANVSGNSLELSWPADHTGWRVETNAVALDDALSWFTLPGSSATNLVTLPVNASETNVFFRLVFP